MARDSASRLGRGLAALIPDAEPRDAGTNGDSAGVRAVPIGDLEPGPFQPRRSMQPDALSELTQSIEAHGVLQPLLARPHPANPSHYQIIAGERRWRAAREAGLKTVPVLVLSIADRDAMAAALVENLQREDLNPVEEAEGYRRLIDEFGSTQEQLGQAIGKSRSHVANALRLLNLPPQVLAAIQDGRLSAGHARALLTHPAPEALASTVIARGLNVRQTEALAAGRDLPGTATEKPPKDPETAALERELSEKLGLRVTISFDGQRGTVSVAYRSLDQLDGIIALLGRAG